MEKVNRETESAQGTPNDGGYWLPRVSHIDKPRKGWFFSGIRWIGNKIFMFGLRFRQLGYYQEEIHPYDSLIKAMRDAKVIKE